MSEFYKEYKKINIANEEFEIKPFVLRTRKQALKIIADIIGKFSTLNPSMKSDDMVNNIPSVIESAGDKLIDLYKLVLDRDDEWLDNNVTLKDEVNIIESIIEVNDIPFLLKRLKELIPKKTI